MFNARLKAHNARMASSLPASTPPDVVVRWRRLTRVRNWLIGIWLGGLATEIAIFPLIAFDSIKYQVLWATGALTGVWFGAACVGTMYHSRLESHIAQTFCSRDVASLGCWIDTLFAPASNLAQALARSQPPARAGLLEQLPLLTEETTYLLRADERRLLYKALHGPDAELILVVLRVVPVLGDVCALAFVRHLADGKGLASKNAQVQAEAQTSLAQLQANLAHASGAQALLRSSEPPHAPQDQLLLPVQSDCKTSAHELLRAASQE